MFNQVVIIGNVGKDMETRFVNDTFSVGMFSVATSYSYKKNEEWENKTIWHSIKIYNPTEYLTRNVTKGAVVAIVGKLEYEEYTNKSGCKKKNAIIVADKVAIVKKGKEKESIGGDQ